MNKKAQKTRRSTSVMKIIAVLKEIPTLIRNVCFFEKP
jgi:hypothetical protein